MEEDKRDLMEDIDDIEFEEVEEIEDEEEKDILTLVYEYIRDKSQRLQLSNAEDLLEEPFELEAEETIELINELKEREEFNDVRIVKRDSAIFLYSVDFISNNYAKFMIMVEEKDLFKLIANTVREESKTYPRPTGIKLFTHEPFKLTRDDLIELLKQMEDMDEYKDIKQVKTSNAKLYLYSEEFMTRQHANSLAEWIEVDKKNNP